MVWVILFWLLFLLCVIGLFVPDANIPGGSRGRWIIILILIGLLGWAVFGGLDQPPRRHAAIIQFSE